MLEMQVLQKEYQLEVKIPGLPAEIKKYYQKMRHFHGIILTRREKLRHSVKQTKFEIPRLINLSNLTLSTQEIQILSKGLKFTPTPQTSNYNEVKDDISKFCRKLCLTEELFDKESRVESIVRNKMCVNKPHRNDLKLRPIVAGPSSETHILSNFLHILLKPILKHIPSFVRDDLDMLNHLPRTVRKDSIMVSFDVVYLYTTIPHEYGLEAIEIWLERFPSKVPNRIEKKFIIEGLKCILQNNYFNFNGESYRQISGTAFGTTVAPSYANLVMAYLEIQMYERSKLQFEREHFEL
ncbi:unnamed protein product [Mytilus coruscus]|uniref:Reverse transcriptase domain-containing protein n=1 Tax=Mytilus coruscus TaxID=42192 RepID=A0A6J8AU60_MYTCO|nr:unnamed protein product [Mytilus coruscus]